jgi:arylsulfatase A-like enzyme
MNVKYKSLMLAGLMSVPVFGAVITTDLGLNDGVAGTDPVAFTLNNTATSATMEYNISGFGFGGTAQTLSLLIASDVGRNLAAGGNNGVAVAGGDNASWWDPGEDLTITLKLLDASSNDVTGSYAIDLVGGECRWRINEGQIATFNGQSIAATVSSTGFESFSLVGGQTTETVLTASRSNVGVAQLASLTYDIALLTAPPTNRPNIIIILTDDHGFTDLGVHGVDANVQTPVLDSLASGGALMRNGYSTAPQCVPSRSGLMSGRVQNTFGTRQNGDIWGRIPVPLDVPTIAERLKSIGGYATGFVGKWHLEIPSTVPDTDFPGTRDDYRPGARGFDEYWYGSTSPYLANFNLAGNTIPEQQVIDARNRVTVQGEAAQAFIERNQNEPFFLYLALFGPHVPLISTTDSYYLDFPALDYPNYNSEMDDVRRRGLALIKAVDDAVGGVMQKLRDLGLEEDTLVFFAGDNGAQPKFWDAIGGQVSIDKWDGSENIPLRGEKGSLWEGGMKVPMFAYWKSHIQTNQIIDDPMSTLDFTATTLKLAGGTIPAEFDGVDVLPRLTGQTNSIVRPKPLFCDWGQEIAMRDGDWKIHRIGDRKSLFNLADDPNELYDLKYVYPARFSAMEAELMAWYNTLPPDGQSPLNELGNDLYVLGAPAGTAVDPRFVIPYTNAAPAAYPAPLQTVADPAVDSDGDGMGDGEERSAGRNPNDPSDMAFEFNTDGDYEHWVPVDFLNYSQVSNGVLSGQSQSNQGKFEYYDFNFDAGQVASLVVRLKSPVGVSLTYRWAHSLSNTFNQARTLVVPYSPGDFQTVVIPLRGLSEWDGHTISKMRLNPVNTLADFEIDWIRGSAGDLDGDLLPDVYESAHGLDAADPADGNADTDGDGFTRGQEYVAGTDPGIGTDFFRISGFDVLFNQALSVSVDGKAGRAYTLWRTDNLVSNVWNPVSAFGLVPSNMPVSLLDTNVQGRAFYKADVSAP